jgi:DNA-entry nuclease
MKKLLAVILACLCALLCACSPGVKSDKPEVNLNEIPEYKNSPYVELNNNNPDFTEKEKQNKKSFEKYSRLDKLGRCGTAYANISTDLMPDEKRGSISSVHPTGWVQNEYAFVQDGHIYNRCHLIGYQLTGENANERNLITGTRYMNVEGMLPFENKVAEYVASTENHVLYRVTPVFEGDNLLANGVEMEAWSVEDGGKGVCFNVYCYNVQPGVMITYANGNNKADGTVKGRFTGNASGKGNKKNTYTYKKSKSNSTETFVLNINSKKFHLPSCDAVKKMKPKNKKTYKGKRSELIKSGYEPCGMCKP